MAPPFLLGQPIRAKSRWIAEENYLLEEFFRVAGDLEVVHVSSPKRRRKRTQNEKQRIPFKPALLREDDSDEEGAADHDCCDSSTIGMKGFPQEELFTATDILTEIWDIHTEIAGQADISSDEEMNTVRSPSSEELSSDDDCARSVALSYMSGLVTDFEDSFDFEADSDFEDDDWEGSTPSGDLNCPPASPISVLRTQSKLGWNMDSTYGHIEGICVGETWQYRIDLTLSGIHCPQKSVIHSGEEGAYSILLRGPFSAKDYGDHFIFNGEPPKPLKRKKKSRYHNSDLNNGKRHQEMCLGNLALQKNMWFKRPVRVVRANTMKNNFSPIEKYQAYRYDGLFIVTEMWREKQYNGVWEYRFAFMKDKKGSLEYKVNLKTVSPSFLPKNLVPLLSVNCSKEFPSSCFTSFQGRVPVVALEKLTAAHFMPGAVWRRNSSSNGIETQVSETPSSAASPSTPKPLGPTSQEVSVKIAESESPLNGKNSSKVLKHGRKKQRNSDQLCNVLRKISLRSKPF